MNDDTYRLNSRVTIDDKEYLIQTLNDRNRRCVTSSVFSDGELLETRDEQLESNVSPQDTLQRVKDAHEERTREIEFLVDLYKHALAEGDEEQMIHLGEALLYKRMHREAEKLFKSAVQTNPEAHQAWVNLGLVHFELRKWSEACEEFSKAVEMRPKFADYRNHLGEAYLALDSCKRAVIEFEEAVKLNVYYGEAYLNLALAYILNAIRREDFKLFSTHGERTAEMLRKSEMIMPDMIDQVYLDGKKSLERGDLEQAFQKLLSIREKRKAAKRRGFANSYLKFMLGAKQINERFLTRRIKNLKDAIAVNPHFADLHNDLAIAYTLLGSYIHQKAVEEYQKALTINPDFEKAKRNLKLSQNELKGFEVLMKAIM